MAKGCWRVRIGKKLKVEQAAYRRSRPQWSVTSALGPVHPMAPQGATRVGGRKSLRHTLLVPFRRLPPWWLALPPCPVGSVSLDSQSPYGSLQHGYHRLTGFSGCFRSPTNPVRWCDSSSLATPLRGGTMGAGHFGQPVFMAAAAEKPNNRASPVEMHPFCRLRRRLPRRGRF